MFSFSSQTISTAYGNLISCPAQVGGIVSILSIIESKVQPLKTYSLNNRKLKLKLSKVFDKTPETKFSEAEPKFIIFSNNWENHFFDTVVKEKIDLLSFAVFFLRRDSFETQLSHEEVIKLFVDENNISDKILETWFSKKNDLGIEYNNDDIEKKQLEFYQNRFSNINFKSITFNSVIQKFAYEFSAAAHIQTLYSGNDIKKSFLYSDVSLNEYYNFHNEKQVSSVDIPHPHNRIIFGAPGTGKSNKFEQDRNKYFGDDYERVTFHPNYSYAQFVGTYKPVSRNNNGKNEITYEYVPGPFIKTWIRAYKSSQPQLLLIEEINRANVAAVFGDVFQLLDRDENGNSEYPITISEDLKRYLSEKEKIDVETISIPANMYIWATMNSADQGVLPMDAAFKRRWDFEYIGIDENEANVADIKIPVSLDGKKSVLWNDFRKKLNEKLSDELKVNEDKLLGPFFLSKKSLENAMAEPERFVKLFESKVIMYLFEDVVKMQPAKLFTCDKLRYSEICKEFESKGMGVFGIDVEVFDM